MPPVILIVRLNLLHKSAKFTKGERLKKPHRNNVDQTCLGTTIYRSSVWHSSLTDENASDIEKVQKEAVTVIMGKDYIDYPHALNELNITEKRANTHRTKLKKKY